MLTTLLAALVLQQIGNPPNPPNETPIDYDPPSRPNILMIVMDDVGMDLIGGQYAEVPLADQPYTPNFDRIAGDGCYFSNAWSNPTCSPTRATIMTGRYSYLTGIGRWLSSSTTFGLRTSETTLPERLDNHSYQSVAIGKWHLGAQESNSTQPGQGVSHPVNSGFSIHQGSFSNPGAGPIDCGLVACPVGCKNPATNKFDYLNWVKIQAGVQMCSTKYMTTDTTDDAIAFLQGLSPQNEDPWFLYVSYNAVHGPLHNPPFAQVISGARNQAKQMMEAMDADIGRLLAEIGYPADDTYVILLSDNGSASGTTLNKKNYHLGCFTNNTSKGTLYEGGVNVPLAIAGPGVVPRETQMLANTTDLFATVCDLAGLGSNTGHSFSLVPIIFGGNEPVRDYVFAEIFEPAGIPTAEDPPDYHERAVCDGRYKLIRRTGPSGAVTNELYDLETDPCELNDLFPFPMNPTNPSPLQLAYEQLETYLAEVTSY